MSLNSASNSSLVSPKILIMVGLGFVLTLGYLWKGSDVLREVAVTEDASPVSVAYLKALADGSNGDSLAKLDLVAQLLKAGELQEAMEVAEALGPEPTLTASARLLLADVWVHAVFQLATVPEQRARYQERAAAQMEGLAGDETLSAEHLPKSIDLARALAKPELAAAAVESVAERAADPSLWKRAADLYLEAGLVRQAALASHSRALGLSGDARREAAQETERLALASGDPSLAADLAAEQLRNDQSAELLLRQVDLELQAGRPSQALGYASALVELQPAASEPRRMLAELALATDRPDVALREYAWLARRQGRASDFEQAVALASGLQDVDALLSLLAWAYEREPSVEMALQVAGLLERAGRTEAAVGMLENARLTFPESKEIFLALRDVLLRDRDYEAAADVAEEMQARFGAAPDELMQRAAIQLRLGDTQSAVELLHTTEARTSADLEAFLAELVVIAGRQELAREVHESLYDRGVATYAQAQRLWLIEYADGELRRAAEIAERTYEKTGEPDALLFALSTRLELEELAEADACIAEAERVGDSIRSRPDYWALRTRRAGLSIQTAMAEGELEEASLQAEQIEALLARAADAYPSLAGSSMYERSTDDAELWRAQVEEASLIPLSSKMWALQDEGQSSGAWALGVQGLRGGLSPEERDAVEAQMEAIAREQPRHVSAQFETTALPDVTTLGTAARSEYAWSKAGVAAGAAARSLSFDLPESTGAVGSSVLEVDAGLGGFVRDPVGKTHGRVGLISRDGRVAPTGKFGWNGTLRDKVTLVAEAGINEIANETSFLRVFGKQDRVQVTVTSDVTSRWFVGASARADRFLDEDRKLLGNGLSVDAQSGYRIWNGRTKWSVAASARAAPRYAKAPLAQDTELINSSAGWTGVTTSFGRGDLQVSVPAKLRPRYLVEASAGVLFPDPAFGYGLRAGVGLGNRSSGELRILGGVTNSTVSSMGQVQGNLELVYAYSLSH